jgi:hypothetical protein
MPKPEGGNQVYADGTKAEVLAKLEPIPVRNLARSAEPE